mgnify:CR=1 FL=1
MSDLLTVQRQFSASTLNGDDTAAGFVNGAGIAADRRLQIHRNNTFVALANALGATFPVVRQLVGDEFFGFMTQNFITASPPKPGPLFRYGDTFAEFIAGFSPAATLAYLSDVARLEWAMNAAYYAADTDPMDMAVLAGIPTEALPETVFRLHPSHRLVAASHPVDRIWRLHQPGGGDERISLNDSAWLLVLRPQSTVEILSLTPGVFNFVLTLDMGQPVRVACDAALACEPEFDLAGAMGALLSAGVFTGIRHEPTNPED